MRVLGVFTRKTGWGMTPGLPGTPAFGNYRKESKGDVCSVLSFEIASFEREQ
jgi:hypothetical protein